MARRGSRGGRAREETPEDTSTIEETESTAESETPSWQKMKTVLMVVGGLTAGLVVLMVVLVISAFSGGESEDNRQASWLDGEIYIFSDPPVPNFEGDKPLSWVNPRTGQLFKHTTREVGDGFTCTGEDTCFDEVTGEPLVKGTTAVLANAAQTRASRSNPCESTPFVELTVGDAWREIPPTPARMKVDIWHPEARLSSKEFEYSDWKLYTGGTAYQFRLKSDTGALTEGSYRFLPRGVDCYSE